MYFKTFKYIGHLPLVKRIFNALAASQKDMAAFIVVFLLVGVARFEAWGSLGRRWASRPPDCAVGRLGASADAAAAAEAPPLMTLPLMALSLMALSRAFDAPL